MNGRARRYLRQNLENAGCLGNDMLAEYRNQVQHLNAVRLAHLYAKDIRKVESYFALYHYIMQRILMDSSGDTDNAEAGVLPRRYFNSVKTYRTYCKDFTKALNIPFCYNLPRYKNLSIDCLFDYNRPGTGDKKNKAIQPVDSMEAEQSAEPAGE